MSGHTLWVGLEEGVHHWRQGLEEVEGRRGGGQGGKKWKGKERGGEGGREWEMVGETKREVAGGIEAKQRGQITVDNHHLCTLLSSLSSVQCYMQDLELHK